MPNLITMVCLDGSEQKVNEIPGCRVVFRGDENNVRFHASSRFSECTIVASEGSFISLGGKGVFRKLEIYTLESRVLIGHRFSCWELEVRAEERKSHVAIGDGCMFSKGIYMYPTDCHTIYDLDSKQCINAGGSIVIGDHVWCGLNTIFLKNSSVNSDSIIAAGSLINKQFMEPNVLMVGSPAKVVRTRVNWDRRSPSEFK